MKIIQVNAWRGYLIHPLMEFILQEKPDILCAQEINSSSQPNPVFHIFQNLEYLKDAGGFEYSFYSPTSSFDAFGAKIDTGNAVLSSIPFINQRTEFVNEQYDPDQTVLDFRFNITNIQICELQLPGNKKLAVANYHGYHDVNPLGTERTIECSEEVAKLLNPFKGSLLLCGDFNISPESPAFKPLNNLGLSNPLVTNKIETTLSEVHRIPTRNKTVCDYILHSPSIKARNFSVSDKIVSDHKALILEFEIQ